MLDSTTTPPAELDSVRAAGPQLAEIGEALRTAGKVLVATHVSPDGDAVGSARAAELILQAVGVDTIVYVPGGAVPPEYGFIRPERLTGEPPADIAERTVLCLDCGNAARLTSDVLPQAGKDVLNIDHHGDNPRYGRLNVVVADAACTTQLVLELAHQMGVSVTPEIATALHVGLVTDTGCFQYSNTTGPAFEMAAQLVAAGASVHGVFQHVFENVPFARLKLLARGLDAAEQYDDGTIATLVTQADFAETGASADDSEGIVDALRSVSGTRLALFVRELEPGSRFRYKGSLRTTQEHVDVSVIARSYAGGGHRQAAGFSTDDDFVDVVANVRAQIAKQLP